MNFQVVGVALLQFIQSTLFSQFLQQTLFKRALREKALYNIIILLLPFTNLLQQEKPVDSIIALLLHLIFFALAKDRKQLL